MSISPRLGIIKSCLSPTLPRPRMFSHKPSCNDPGCSCWGACSLSSVSDLKTSSPPMEHRLELPFTSTRPGGRKHDADDLPGQACSLRANPSSGRGVHSDEKQAFHSVTLPIKATHSPTCRPLLGDDSSSYHSPWRPPFPLCLAQHATSDALAHAVPPASPPLESSFVTDATAMAAVRCGIPFSSSLPLAPAGPDVCGALQAPSSLTTCSVERLGTFLGALWPPAAHCMHEMPCHARMIWPALHTETPEQRALLVSSFPPRHVPALAEQRECPGRCGWTDLIFRV